MSMLEWLGESFDPGSMGGAEIGPRDRGRRPRSSVLACGIIALILLACWFLILGFGLQLQTQGWMIAPGATVTYLLAAYFLHPRPDYDNIGWFGGLFDHPFRCSDDINRQLIFFLIILFPGRFLAESVVDMGRMLVRPNKRKKKRRSQKVEEWS